MSEGRKRRDGLHQAIEAKEAVDVTIDTGHAARVTIQDYFLRYPHLAGMTGTAMTSAREMHKIYRLRVMPIPTNRPPIRVRQPDRIFGTAEAKNDAIVEEVRRIHDEGRPVLIGTRSIDKSEQLSALHDGRRHSARSPQCPPDRGGGGDHRRMPASRAG